MSAVEQLRSRTERAAPAPRLYVGSEVGTLRRVLLHRPDLELKRLAPTNKDELLFDDVLWVERARQEHDAFADTLAEAGVEVFYLQELLGDVLEDTELRRPAGGSRCISRPSTATIRCSRRSSTRSGATASRCRRSSRAATSSSSATAPC